MGNLDVMIEAGTQTYDYAALPPIVEGAGGHMCDWNGKPLTIESDGNLLAVGDIALKDQLLDILKN
jgi:fructose-1,6-bisphosphatase/inositol monophosphatase family enzyme